MVKPVVVSLEKKRQDRRVLQAFDALASAGRQEKQAALQAARSKAKKSL